MTNESVSRRSQNNILSLGGGLTIQKYTGGVCLTHFANFTFRCICAPWNIPDVANLQRTSLLFVFIIIRPCLCFPLRLKHRENKIVVFMSSLSLFATWYFLNTSLPVYLLQMQFNQTKENRNLVMWSALLWGSSPLSSTTLTPAVGGGVQNMPVRYRKQPRLYHDNHHTRELGPNIVKASVAAYRNRRPLVVLSLC